MKQKPSLELNIAVSYDHEDIPANCIAVRGVVRLKYAAISILPLTPVQRGKLTKRAIKKCSLEIRREIISALNRAKESDFHWIIKNAEAFK